MSSTRPSAYMQVDNTAYDGLNSHALMGWREQPFPEYTNMHMSQDMSQGPQILQLMCKEAAQPV